MPKALLPLIALFFANLIYAVNYGLAKDVMGEGYLQAFSFILFRVVGAVVLFWLVSIFSKKEKIEKKDYMKFGICGLFGVAANQLMFFEGLHHTSTINASIIMVTNPILVLILAAVILKEKLSLRKMLGVGIGLTGAVLLILFRGKGVDEQSTLWGDLLILFNATCYGIYLILAKPLMSKYSPLTVVKWVFTFGLIFVLPFGLSQVGEIKWNMPSEIVLEIIYVVVFTTFFAYLLNIYGLKKVSPTVASSFIYLQPILTTVIAVYLGSETLDWQKVVFGIIIFSGVFIVSIPQKSRN
jgi:drug/metabolite transporter (DMT)-like permease